MSKHRRPSRLARVRQVGHSPLQLSIAASIAGTVAVTGTVVASAADDGSADIVRTVNQDDAVRPAVATAALQGTDDLGSPESALALRDAVETVRVARSEALAEARAKAIAKRKAEKRAAARRAAERRAEERAAEARTFTAASRDVERMSASAANVLEVAAQVSEGAYYTYGGTGPKGFDCSGFTSYVFSKVGVSLPRTSSAQAGVVQRVSDPQPGDLVFVYNGGGGSIGHVAIYAGGGYWWEAANPNKPVGKFRAWSSDVSYGRIL